MASMPATSRPEAPAPAPAAAAAFADVGPSTRFFAVVLPVVRVAPRGEPAVAAVAPVAPAVVYVPAYVLVDPARVAGGLDPIAPEVLPGSFRGAREPSSRAVRSVRPVGSVPATVLASVAGVPVRVVLGEGHGRHRTRALHRRAALGALALHLLLPREPVQPEQRSARLRRLEDVRRAVAAAAGRTRRFAGHAGCPTSAHLGVVLGRSRKESASRFHFVGAEKSSRFATAQISRQQLHESRLPVTKKRSDR